MLKMSLGVSRVNKLTGNKAVGNLLCKLVSLGNGALHTFGSVRKYKLGTVCLHKLTALNRHGFGHNDDDAIALCSGHCGKTDAGVARGGLDNYRSFF